LVVNSKFIDQGNGGEGHAQAPFAAFAASSSQATTAAPGTAAGQGPRAKHAI